MSLDLLGHIYTFGPIELGKFVMLLLAVSLHESAHAYVATWCGDDTPRSLGRRTLNPVSHLHPIMSVLLPAVFIFGHFPYLFGAGRPVPIQPSRMRKPDRDAALVALAGPATNLLLTILCTALLVAGLKTGVLTSLSGDTPKHWAGEWLRSGIQINLILMCFNLIPVPPLDGSRFLAYLLPGPIKRLWFSLDAVGFVILIVLLYFRIIQRIMDATYLPLWGWWKDLYGRWAA